MKISRHSRLMAMHPSVSQPLTSSPYVCQQKSILTKNPLELPLQVLFQQTLLTLYRQLIDISRRNPDFLGFLEKNYGSSSHSIPLMLH